MERIIIEVDDAVAKKWRSISPKLRDQIQKNLAQQMQSLLQKTKEANFSLLLAQASDEAAKNGLTEEILQQLLNEE